MARMEAHMRDLETLVRERTGEMLREKQRFEELLYDIMPKYVIVVFHVFYTFDTNQQNQKIFSGAGFFWVRVWH